MTSRPTRSFSLGAGAPVRASRRCAARRWKTRQPRPTPRPDAFATRRCIVPAAAFYEWRKIGKKQPFAFARQDGQPIALAGLWEGWRALSPA